MKAVILVAGVARRLRPLTDVRPKCLLDVDGEPILARSLRALAEAGVHEWILVTGYLEEQVRKDVGARFPDAQVTYQFNPEYDTLNNCASVLAARGAVEGQDFLVVDGDLIFSAQIAQRLLVAPGKNAIAVRPSLELGAEEMKVLVRPGTTSITHIHKSLPPKDSLGEAIGIHRIGAASSSRLFRTLEERIARGLGDEYYEDSFQALMDLGEDFQAVDVAGEFCMEIDTAEDLETVGRAMRARAKE